MAQDQLEEIKRKIDIVQFINSYVPLKKAGQNYKALCPFHSETVPSFVVSPERQIWHCFGQCGEGGDIFRFLMKIENLEFGEALRELAKKAGVKLTSYRPSEGEKEKQVLYEINHLASEYYHYLLINHPVGKKALAYILGRGISKKSLVQFKLGYAPNLWEGLQQFLVGKKNYPAVLLEKAGLIIARGQGRTGPPAVGAGYYDRFRGRLMFPLKDHRGNLCGFAGRILEPGAKEAKYINTPETLIYHKSDLLYGISETGKEVKKADAAIIVEGELDAISSYQAGVKNVVAIKGSALTLSQIQLLSRFTKNLIFALDADLAGDLAAKRGIEMADSQGMAMKVVEIRGGKDPDEVAQKNPSLWQKLVNEAVPIYDYFLHSALNKFGVQTADGKRQVGQEFIPVLAKISDKIVQAHYIQLLAENLGVDEEAVVAQISSYQLPASEAKSTADEKRIISPGRREVLESHLLGLAFQSGNWEWLKKRKVWSLVKTPRFLSILETLGHYLKRFKTKESRRLAKMLAPELRESFNYLYLLDLADLLEDEEKLKNEFAKTLYQLGKLDIKEKLKNLSEEIHLLKKEKGLEKFRDLSAALTKLDQE